MTERVSISLTFTEFKLTDMKTHNHGESAEILGVLRMLPVVDSPGALATAPQRGQGTRLALRPLTQALCLVLCWALLESAADTAHVLVLRCSVSSTLWGLMDCSLQVFSFHGILQARTLQRVSISYSRGSSPPRNWIHISWDSWIGRWPPGSNHSLRMSKASLEWWFLSQPQAIQGWDEQRYEPWRRTSRMVVPEEDDTGMLGPEIYSPSRGYGFPSDLPLWIHSEKTPTSSGLFLINGYEGLRGEPQHMFPVPLWSSFRTEGLTSQGCPTSAESQPLACRLFNKLSPLKTVAKPKVMPLPA